MMPKATRTWLTGLLTVTLLAGGPALAADQAPAGAKMPGHGDVPQSITMEWAVRHSLRTHPQSTGALEALDAAEYKVKVERSRYFPTLDLRGAYGLEWSENPTLELQGKDNETFQRQEAEVILNQLIFDGFGVDNKVEESSHRAQAEAFRVADTQEVLALRAAEAYLDVLQQREQVTLAQENLAAKERRLGEIEDRKKGGVGTASDVDQAMSRLSQAKSVLIGRVRDLAVAKANFEEVVGAPPRNLAPALDLSDRVPSAMEAVIAKALKDHPALERRRMEILAAQDTIEGNDARWWPRIELEAGASRNRNLDGVEGKNNDIRALLVGRWNVFSGGGDFNEGLRLEAVKRENVEGMKALELVVKKNVQTSWAELEAARTDYLQRQETVKFNQQVVSAFEDQFNLNKRTLLDVLNEEDTLYRSKSAALEGRYNVMLYEYRLLAAESSFLDHLQVKGPHITPPADYGRWYDQWATATGQK